MLDYSLLIPIFGIVGGVSIALIAIITQFKLRKEMVEKGMEIPEKKPTPFGGLKTGALFIGAAIGLLLGGVLENMNVFDASEVGYFSCIFLFAGLGLVLATLYIRKEIKDQE